MHAIAMSLLHGPINDINDSWLTNQSVHINFVIV